MEVLEIKSTYKDRAVPFRMLSNGAVFKAILDNKHGPPFWCMKVDDGAAASLEDGHLYGLSSETPCEIPLKAVLHIE